MVPSKEAKGTLKKVHDAGKTLPPNVTRDANVLLQLILFLRMLPTFADSSAVPCPVWAVLRVQTTSKFFCR
jgi:hypothetical protein